MVKPAPELVFVGKNFAQLSVDELYAALRLRSEVFVVEQNCVYPDLDGKDQQSRHLLCWSEPAAADAPETGHLAAYCRWYEDGDEIVLGRILTSPAMRGQGTGRKLMREALGRIGERPMRLSAQAHLEGFYNEFDFIARGEPFDDAGIPHILMVRRA